MSEPTNGRTFAPVPGKIPGIVVNLGGQELIVAPLNLAGVKAFEALQKEREAEKDDSMEGQIRYCARALLLSLRRNYPEITVDEIVELLDSGNVGIALAAIAGQSGFKVAKPGET